MSRPTKQKHKQVIRSPKEILSKTNPQLDNTIITPSSDGQILLKNHEQTNLPIYRSLEDIFVGKNTSWEEEEIYWGNPMGDELDES